MNDQTHKDLSSHKHAVNLEESEWRTPSVAVVAVIAELSGREIERLDPLSASVNPDALDDLLAQSDESTAECRLSFRYQGYRVEFTGDRKLRLTPVEN